MGINSLTKWDDPPSRIPMTDPFSGANLLLISGRVNINEYSQILPVSHVKKASRKTNRFFSDMILTLGDSNDLGLSMIVAYRTMPMNNNNTKMSIIFHDQAKS